MTENRCVCRRCLHQTCPQPDATPPFDEVTHEIENNFVSVRIPKNTGEYEPENVPKKREDPSFDFNCSTAEGEKCKTGCTKVHVIPNACPPEKLPDEEMLSLKTVTRTFPNDDTNTTLEIEFKAPRNYVPLVEYGPPPPIIIPKQRIKKKGKSKKKKKKKKT